MAFIFRGWSVAESLLRFFHPVLSVKKLKKKPIAVQVGDEKLVLFRNSKGEVAALKDRCPHRFTPLSTGKVNSSGQIECPYHGWKFNEKGEGVKPGQCDDRITCRLPAYKVIEKYNYIWVGQKNADESKIPEYHDGRWAFLDSYSFEFDAPLHVALDNFSEDEHFPFVHKIFGWDERQVNDVEFSCERQGDKVNVHYWGPQRSFFGMRFLLAKPGQYLDNKWEQEYDPVKFTYTSHLTDINKNIDAPGYNRVTIYFVPVGDNKTQLHVFQFVKFQKEFWYKIMPMLKPTYVSLVKNDLKNDADFTKKLNDVPYSLKGMALGKYDEPLKYNRELLEKVYFGETRVPSKLERPPEKPLMKPLVEPTELGH